MVILAFPLRHYFTDTYASSLGHLQFLDRHEQVVVLVDVFQLQSNDELIRQVRFTSVFLQTHELDNKDSINFHVVLAHKSLRSEKCLNEYYRDK